MLEKIKDKYVFFDLDGTLSEYRFNDHVSGRNDYGGQTFEELFFGDVFLKNRPLNSMVDLISNLDSNKVYVLGAIVTNNEVNQKYKWLSKYYPMIKRENIVFVACDSKTPLKLVAIKEYIKKLGINQDDVVFVDDTHETIRKVEEAGIKAYHITSFID